MLHIVARHFEAWEQVGPADPPNIGFYTAGLAHSLNPETDTVGPLQGLGILEGPRRRRGGSGETNALVLTRAFVGVIQDPQWRGGGGVMKRGASASAPCFGSWGLRGFRAWVWGFD